MDVSHCIAQYIFYLNNSNSLIKLDNSAKSIALIKKLIIDY
jgi:hypothetical protein